MGKQDPILQQIEANRKRYLAEEKFRKQKLKEEYQEKNRTPQSVMDGTDPDYGAPEGFQDYTTFGDTPEARLDSSKKLIQAEIKAVEEAKKQQLLEQQKNLAVWNDPKIQEQFGLMRNFNAAINQPGGVEVDPNSLSSRFPGIENIVPPNAQQFNVPQRNLETTGQITVEGQKKVGVDEKAKNKVTNFLIDAGLYGKPISENIRSIIDPLVTGKEKIVKGADDVMDGDVLRGSANLVTGTLQSAMNMIPAVVGLNATMPIMNQVGGSVAEGLGYTREQGEKVTGLIAPFLFGKWIGAASLASFGVDEGLTATGVLDNLSPEDQIIARELIGHLAFFGTLIGGKKISKTYLDPKLDKAFPYTRGMKADLNDPKVTRIMEDYAERFREKEAELATKQRDVKTQKEKKDIADEFNKWAQDEMQKIIQNEKPAFFRNVKKDLDNLREQRRYKRSQSKEPLQKLNVDPNQVDPKTGFTNFEFTEPTQQNAPKTPGSDIRQPKTDLGSKLVAGQELVSPQRSIEAPKGTKPIITPKPVEPSSGKPIITPPAELKAIPKKASEDFDTYVKRLNDNFQSKRKQIKELVNTKGAVALERGDGRVITLSKDPKQPGSWKVAWFDDKGAIGDTQYQTLERAIQEFANDIGSEDLGKLKTPERVIHLPGGEDPLKDVRKDIRIKISDDKAIDIKNRIEKAGGKFRYIQKGSKPSQDLIGYDPIVDHPGATPTTFNIPMDYFRKDPGAVDREVKRLNKKYVDDLNKIQDKKKPLSESAKAELAAIDKRHAESQASLKKTIDESNERQNKFLAEKKISKDQLLELPSDQLVKFQDEYRSWLEKNYPELGEKPASVSPAKNKGKKDVPKKVKRKVVAAPASKKQQIVDTKLEDIVKSEKDFQGRSEAFSGESFKRIVTARIQTALDENKISEKKAEDIITAANKFLEKNNPGTTELSIEDLTPENTFSWNDFGQVLLWNDPKGGLKLLSGHSRTAAAEFLKDYFDEFNTIPSMVESGISFEAAQKKALQSNIRGTAESLLSHVKKIQALRSKGKSEKEIKAVAKTFYGSDANKIVNMSLLNPDGFAIKALKQAEKDPVLNTIANWIGNVKSNYPGLTADHENEIFKWLFDDNAYNTIVKNMTQLNDLIDRRVNNVAFDPATPLNLRNAKGKGGNVMQDYEREVADKKQELNNAKADLEKARGKWAAKGLEGKELEDKIANENAYVNRIEAEYQKLLLKKNAVIDAEMDQGSLFAIKDNYENRIRKIQAQLSMEQQAMFPDDNKIQLLKTEIKKIEMQKAQADAQLGIQADIVKKEFGTAKKEFDISTADLPELKNYQVQLESQGDKLSIDNAILLDKISRKIKGIESVGEQENLFEPEQGSLFNIRKTDPIYPQSADDLPSLGTDVLGRNIPDWRSAVVYHSTDKPGIKDITKGGFRLLGSREQGGYYGLNAISFTPDYLYTKNFGGYTVTAQLDPDVKILNLNSEKDAEIFSRLIKGKDPSKYIDYVVEAGYDGLYDPGAGDLFIGNPKKVKVKPAATETPAFKSWFRNSKVVGKDGSPLVVYHGTNSKFSVIKMNKGAQGLFWFGSDPIAIKEGNAGASGTDYLMDLYVRIENPAGWNEYEKYGIGQLKDLGYDGVILNDGDGGFVGFVFEPDQVKSASKNIGSYSKKDPSILFAISNADGMRDLSGMSKDQAQLIRLKDYRRHLQLALSTVEGKEGLMPVVQGVTGRDYSTSYFRKEMQLREEIAEVTRTIEALTKRIPAEVRLDNQLGMFSGEEPKPEKIKVKQNEPIAEPEDLGSQLSLFNIKRQTGLKKIKSFKTAEGSFETYDVNNTHPGRPEMFTLYKGKDGYVVRNVVVPEDKQRHGLATEFYIAANEESIAKTGQPLKSSPARKLYNGEMVTELTDDGVKLWDSFVVKGLAEKLGDRQYRFFGGDKTQSIEPDDPGVKDLIVVHNLQDTNLYFADKVGGLAMPSMAVVRKQLGFDKYGAISLIADPSLIDPKRGGRVFNRDIYSPTYPTVYRKINKKLLFNKIEQLKKKLPDELQQDSYSSIHNIIDRMEKESYTMQEISSYNDFLDYAFLNERNLLPKLVYKDEPLHMTHHLPEWNGQYKAAKELVKNYPMITEKFERDPVEVKKIMDDLIAKNPDYYKNRVPKEGYNWLKRDAEDLYDEAYNKKLKEELKKFVADYNETYLESFKDDPELYDAMKIIYKDRDLDKWYFDEHGILQDVKRLLNPKKVLAPSKMRESIEKAIKPLKDEFDAWIQEYFADVHGEEYLKAGTRKIPHTLQNAVDIMGTRLKGTEKTMVQGLGKSAVISAKEFTSLDDIKKSKDRLVTSEVFHEKERAMKDKFMELADSFSRYYKYGDGFGFERLDNLSLAVGKLAASKMSDEKIRSLLYSADYRNVPDWYYDDMREVARLMKEMPTEYFEAKDGDIVKLKQFAGALIPKGASPKVRQTLEYNGVNKIIEYDPDVKGDRIAKLNEFADEMFNITDDMDKYFDELMKGADKRIDNIKNNMQQQSSYTRKLATDYKNDSVLLRDTTLTMHEDRRYVIETPEIWITKYHYDPRNNPAFELLKEGDPEYVKGVELYKAPAAGRAIQPSRENGWKGNIDFYGETDMATILEEVVHIFQAEVKRFNPKLAQAIKVWESEARQFAREQGITLPLGKELFAKCFVAQSGYTLPDDTVFINQNIYDATVQLLNHSRSGEKIFDKYLKPQKLNQPASSMKPDTKGYPSETEAQLELFNIRAPGTPEFKKWFGNSKAVDKNGNPKIMYHGTRNVFEIFKPGKNDIGIHVGTLKHAERLLKSRLSEKLSRQNIMPVFIRAEKPLRLKDIPTTREGDKNWDTDHIADELVRLKILSPKAAYLMDLEMLKDYIKDQGYDSIVYENIYEGRKSDTDRDSYILFNPTQIKSVFNEGTFDAQEPNILFNVKAPGEETGTPRMDKYVNKVMESMPSTLSPEKEARLSELKKFKELTAEEKTELKKLKDEKAQLLAEDPFEKHRLSTLIKMKIRNLRTGYKIGAEERQKQLTDLKKDIAAYARLILPRAEYRKSEVTPLLTELAKAKDLDGAAKAFTRIRDLERKVRKRILIGKINKIIRNADRTKGDPDFVIAIKNIRRMKAEDIETEIAKIYERAANRELTDEEDQFLYLLQRFSDIKNRSVEDLEDLYQELKEAIIEGRSRRKEWLAKEKERIQDLKKKSIEVITGGKEVMSDDRARAEGLDKDTVSTMQRLSDVDSMMHSWEWMMDKISKHDKTSSPLRSFLNEYFADKVFDARNVEDAGMRSNLKLLRDKMMQIYGTSKHDLTKQLSKNSERKETLAARVHVVERDEAGIPTKTENVRLVMSQNEAAYMLMVHEDPQLAKTFEKMGYTEDTWTKLKAFVDPKVMEWARWQLDVFYPEYYKGVNEVYKQMRGVDLQFNKKYMPISRDVAQTVLDQEFLGDINTEHVSIFNGHLQPRVSNTHAIRIQDIDRVLMEHIIEMEHFKAFAAVMKDLRGVFGSREVSKAIKQYHSAATLQVINRFINDFARGGVDRRLTVNLLDKIRANFAKSVIGLNPVVFIKQLTAIPAYLMDIPAKDFVSGIANFMLNPVGKAKFLLKNSETLKSRYSKGWERDVILAMQRARKTTAKELSGGITFTDIIMSLTKFGDAGAIFPGGWATYKYFLDKEMKAGKSYEAAKIIAIKEFEKATKRSQAAGDVEDLGEIQRQGSWAKMWTLFKTAPKQYYSNMSGALRNLVFKRGKKSENLKRLFVAHVLLPQIFQWTANGFDWKAGSQIRALAIGSLNGILIAGDILESAIMAIMGDAIYSADDTPLTAISQDIYKALKQLNKYVESFDKDAEDLLKTIDELASAFTKFFGVPYDPVKKVATGVKDFAEDPDETNALRLVGFSKFILQDDKAEKSDTLKLIQERQNTLNDMKDKARKTMSQEDINKAKQYEKDLKELKAKSSDWQKKLKDDKDKKKDDPFKKPKKPQSELGKMLKKGL